MIEGAEVWLCTVLGTIGIAAILAAVVKLITVTGNKVRKG